jgi:hypothetical protein
MSANDSLVGQSLGKYRIQAELGRGGMGVVYRGYDPALGRPVAIKVLPLPLTYDAQFVQRFHQEAVLAARLHHPGIVPIHDVGEQGGIHYIVMQFLEGMPLEDWLQRQGPLAPADIRPILRQVADALDYAHGRGVIHRDIKPANVMLGLDGRATLMDFGLVRAAEGTSLTRSGTVMGTPEYMSPEQALGEEVDGRSDIYSLGIVLYKMLSGRVPFARTTPYAITYAHIHEPPPPLREVRADLPVALETVVDKALAKRRDDRYPRAGLLADDFDAAATGRPLAAGTAARASPAAAHLEKTHMMTGGAAPPAKAGPPRWLLWAAGAAALLLVVAIAALLLGRGPDERAAQTPPAALAISSAAEAVAATSTPAPSATLRTVGGAATPAATETVLVQAALLTSQPTSTPEPEATAPASPTTPVPAQETGLLLAVRSDLDAVNVRSGPGTAYPKIGQLKPGPQFAATGRNAAGDWLQFAFNGQPAWVASEFVNLTGDVASVAEVHAASPPPTAVPPPTAPPTPCSVAAGPTFGRVWSRTVLGCPVGDEFGLTSAYESFQRGWMLWRQDNDRHYALFNDGDLHFYTYAPEEPPDFACPEAQALGRPRRGFSRVWCENADVRSRIGNALDDEIGDSRPVQEFENGFMIYVKERGTIATILNSGKWAEVH